MDHLRQDRAKRSWSKRKQTQQTYIEKPGSTRNKLTVGVLYVPIVSIVLMKIRGGSGGARPKLNVGKRPWAVAAHGLRCVVEGQIRGSAVDLMLHVTACCWQLAPWDPTTIPNQAILINLGSRPTHQLDTTSRHRRRNQHRNARARTLPSPKPTPEGARADRDAAAARLDPQRDESMWTRGEN
ncbi:hypothetical protein EVAR_101045_1 [Eumeta japonica]|uniref:Uncharacterized protein n=1 Tax=Eumeta variegata TaxID=151549 RepID=A0A4C1SK88_EUMVA|nr:hypothetical protein EVAR_101045_1 [Eumeta japonica]